jgi:hypothetical protein
MKFNYTVYKSDKNTWFATVSNIGCCTGVNDPKYYEDHDWFPCKAEAEDWAIALAEKLSAE